jgi:next to BRCA1 gene 1 protein
VSVTVLGCCAETHPNFVLSTLEIFAATTVAQPAEKIGSPVICLPQGSAVPEMPTIAIPEPETIPGPTTSEPVSELVTAVDATLRATAVADVNIPDGQVFPPGAEFVKAWLVRNDGETSWPETTELVWVAGDRMLPDDATDARVHVGAVKPGEVITVSAPEMKAPDAAGKYVSYWKLSDGSKGRELFGNNVWAE